MYTSLFFAELSQWPCGNRNPQPEHEPPLSSCSGPPPIPFIVWIRPSMFPWLSAVHHCSSSENDLQPFCWLTLIFHAFMERKVRRDRKVGWRSAGMTCCVVLQVSVSPAVFLNWSTHALHHALFTASAFCSVIRNLRRPICLPLHNAQPITHNAP